MSPTVVGYIEPGLTNREFSAGHLTGGTYHAVRITFNNTSGGPASFRFAYSRAAGDIADAAAAAKGKSLAIVFANDNAVKFVSQGGPSGVSDSANTPIATLPDSQVRLIDAVAAANPNTVVVLNTGGAVIVQPWINNVKAVLDMC